ncbi:MAG: XdhC family protein [Xanthomonadales bacterium]|jgi:xanthine/CO dehydrogenase XdhC/CoxF family maturation factor|nr:XdhC family protein [Xanthomonadales bacterium]
MNLGLESLQAFLAANRDAPALVLATVIATEGSTYRKPGAMLLSNAEGEFAGLISGGCLEGDLVAQARDVLESGAPRRLSYDLKDDDELVLGLGLGCGGAVHLLLQRLVPDDDFAPLGPLFERLARGQRCQFGLVIEGDRLAESAVLDAGGGGWGAEDLGAALAAAPPPRPGRAGRARRVSLRASANELLCVDVQPTPRVLVCGAGLDALPLARQVLALDWRCTLTDHRPASLAADRLPPGVEAVCARPGKLGETTDLAAFDAAVVMTHHVEHDAAYLAQLAKQPPAYLGVLGPRARRDQLLETIGRPDLAVRGPVGLDLGAELPEAIALAIMAEIHAVLAGRQAGSLDRG